MSSNIVICLLFLSKLLTPSSFSFLSTVVETKVCNVMFIGHGDHPKSLPCESSGQESILDMIKNKIGMLDVKTSLNPDSLPFFFFKTADNDCLNIGLPVGALSEKENYSCEFRRKSLLQVTDYMRRYDVNEYSSSWNMLHFYVSLSVIAAGVTPFKTKIHADPNMRLRVDFFKDESILEALVRDRRFDVKNIGACGVNCDRKPYPLSYKAVNCQNKTVEIYSLSKKDTSLPQLVLPRPHPDPLKTSVKAEASEVREEDSVVTAGPSRPGLPAGSSIPGSTTGISQASAPKTLTQLIGSAFKTGTLDKELTKQLAKECGIKYRNFALNQGLSIPARQVRDLAKTLDAVGAIYIQNVEGSFEFLGTCFGTGEQYIVTNHHVYVRLIEAAAAFIDFNYEEGVAPSIPGQRYEPAYFLVSGSEELDYAILKLKERNDKVPPPCIFKTGVTIMDPHSFNWSKLEGHRIHLIGHPNGQRKDVDFMCPVVTDGLELYIYALRRGKESAQANTAYLNAKMPKRGMYHVSSFFYGSSGSPGILFQHGKKLLVVLHTRGVFLSDQNRSFIEQGVQFTEIVKHVNECIHLAQEDRSGQNRLKGVRLTDIFPGVDTCNWSSSPMDIDN